MLANADFKNVPSFLDASFHEPPRVDNMAVADPLKRFHKWKQMGVSDPRGLFFKAFKVCADPDASAKFRRLKKLAFEAQDLTREQEFFAQEFRCRRFWLDKPAGRGVARFWLGWAYGGVANFGRSLIRPMMLWLASILVFARVSPLVRRRGGAVRQSLRRGFFRPAFGVAVPVLPERVPQDRLERRHERQTGFRLPLRRRAGGLPHAAAERVGHVAVSGFRQRGADLHVPACASKPAQGALTLDGAVATHDFAASPRLPPKIESGAWRAAFMTRWGPGYLKGT